MDEELAHRLSTHLNNWAPGIRIIAVRLTKPKIPERIRKLYEAIDEQKSKYLVTTIENNDGKNIVTHLQ